MKTLLRLRSEITTICYELAVNTRSVKTTRPGSRSDVIKAISFDRSPRAAAPSDFTMNE